MCSTMVQEIARKAQDFVFLVDGCSVATTVYNEAQLLMITIPSALSIAVALFALIAPFFYISYCCGYKLCRLLSQRLGF